MEQLCLPHIVTCECSKECDCQNPPPDDWDGKDGVFGVSNSCPVHNLYPYSDPHCLLHQGKRY